MINLVVLVRDKNGLKVSVNKEDSVNSNTGTDRKLLSSFWKLVKVS